MKKLLILAAVIVAGVAANAASFNWSAANIYSSDLTTKYSGAINLYVSGVADLDGVVLSTVSANNGVVTTALAGNAFSSDKLVAGTTYDFFFTFEDGGKVFTSATKAVAAQATATSTIQFANMASQTQNASNWAAVPEPTSGLLMLLGMAGLALKRKRA